jgi:hypothetical protein
MCLRHIISDKGDFKTKWLRRLMGFNMTTGIIKVPISCTANASLVAPVSSSPYMPESSKSDDDSQKPFQKTERSGNVRYVNNRVSKLHQLTPHE